jgi:hypothetical protein
MFQPQIPGDHVKTQTPPKPINIGHTNLTFENPPSCWYLEQHAVSMPEYLPIHMHRRKRLLKRHMGNQIPVVFPYSPFS